MVTSLDGSGFNCMVWLWLFEGLMRPDFEGYVGFQVDF